MTTLERGPDVAPAPQPAPLPAEPPLHPESGFYYGWVMFPVAVAMILCSLPGQSVVVSQFNSAFRTGLGLSLESLSAAYLIGTLAAAFPQRRIGRLADTIGTRTTTGLVALGLLLGCLVVARSVNLASLTLGFFLIRLFGQGAMGMLSSHLLAHWFERRLATTESIKNAAFSAAMIATPQTTFWLIGSVGWRTSYAVMGLSVCALLLPAVLTFFRDKPADVGQHLDNEPPGEHRQWKKAHARRIQPAIPARYTLKETQRTLVFWALILPGMLSGLVGTAMIFHIQPVLEHIGVTNYKEIGADALSAWGAVLMVTGLTFGPVADRVPPRVLIPLGSLFQAASFAAMGLATTGTGAIVSMALYGLSQGIYSASFGPAIARFFGRPHHGEIRGFITTLFVAGTASGPYLVALGARLSGGSFSPPYLVGALAAIGLGVLATRAIRPAPIPAAARE